MLSYFNKLPPKPSYINKVLKALSSAHLTLSQIQTKTSLTRTQVTCTLDKLIAEKVIVTHEEKGKKYYGIKS
ncbi:hypothetical protein DXX92_01045 [Thalassotalea euphylliae]|uniref:MarR family transcriptional regulator n=1 Tax=Thalassotalea euphylliae TaxID=1655234 RepID=A0A3E0UAZ5_9GAMM|nr:hypothetical protein DXX92_01045 [Thalassotalea euphylliae]